MDHWDLAARRHAPSSDPVRHWAEIEGKSPTMSEDLYEQQALHQPSRLNPLATIATAAKLLATIIHAWLNDSR